MSAVNVKFEANITADPELKTTQAGKQFMSIRLAANERKFNKQTNSWEDADTTYLSAAEWDTRQIAAYQKVLHKGSTVYVEGVLRVTTSLDSNGQPKAYLNVDHSTIRLVLKKEKEAANSNGGFIGRFPHPDLTQPTPAADFGGDPWASASGEPQF